jgi:glycerol-3-phosphate cytidylyltransferase
MTTRPPRLSGGGRGYVPGVFDMFHVGHLNVISAARPHCDHLIVGVVTDEVVTAVKGRPPVIPLGERMEIVAALRDVDEVVVDVHRDKFDSWQDVRFDVVFRGDDWAGTQRGRKLEADLATVHARVHYFPYTRHTSSSLLRDVLGVLSNELVGPDRRPVAERAMMGSPS